MKNILQIFILMTITLYSCDYKIPIYRFEVIAIHLNGDIDTIIYDGKLSQYPCYSNVTYRGMNPYELFGDNGTIGRDIRSFTYTKKVIDSVYLYKQ